MTTVSYGRKGLFEDWDSQGIIVHTIVRVKAWQSVGMVPWEDSKSSLLGPQAWVRESSSGMVWTFKNSKLPWQYSSSSKATYPNHCSQIPLTEDQVFKYLRQWRARTSQPPQAVLCHLFFWPPTLSIRSANVSDGSCVCHPALVSLWSLPLWRTLTKRLFDHSSLIRTRPGLKIQATWY